MRSQPRCGLPVLFLAVLLCTLSTPSHAFTCFSPSLYNKIVLDMFHKAKNTALSRKQALCLYNKGLNFPPIVIETVPGREHKCYNHTAARIYHVNAIIECVGDDTPLTRLRTDPRPVARRRLVLPTSPARAVAHWLGLYETVREDICSCWSGCHFCCVLTGLGGDTNCISYYCSGEGYCK